jgi:hypothetical protein
MSIFTCSYTRAYTLVYVYTHVQVGEAHRRTKAVAAALEVVQGQLAEEERRSSTLTSTLSKFNYLQYKTSKTLMTLRRV